MFRKTLAFSAALIFAACESTAPNERSVVIGNPVSGIAMPSAKLDKSVPLTRIGFGSCLKEKDDMSIWNTIGAEDPDLFVFLGDNVYGDLYPDNPQFTDP